MNQNKLGISTYCYFYACGGYRRYPRLGYQPQPPVTPEWLIDKAVALGVQCVQISDNYDLQGWSDERLRRLGEYAQYKKISLELGLRGIQPENLQRYLHMAHEMKVELLRCVIDAPGFEPDFDTIYRILHAVVPQLEQRHLLLGIENHDRFTTRQFADLIRRLNHPGIGMLVDTVNSFATEESPSAILHTLAPCAVGLHVKDYTIARRTDAQGLVVKGTIAGKGRLDVPGFVREMRQKAQKKDFSVILESWMEPEAELNATLCKEERWVQESIAYLKQVL
ncbi:MAG: sugar phosphate isomerase/epimerase family protein [Eubacteriales bacterium]|jgi:sugar phosphate isomerase/epimerase